MDIRKDDTERAVNLLKLYKSKLNKPDERSLKKAMDKLIETLEAPLFSALMDIQEFYEVSLSTAIDGNESKPRDVIEEVNQDVQDAPPSKLKKEKSKKSKRRQKTEEEDEEVAQMSPAQMSQQKYSAEPLSPKQSSRDYQDSQSKPNYQEEEYEEHEEVVDDENNPWIYFQFDLVKGNKGYGFGVAGGYNKPHYEGDNGIFVSKIIPNGVAEVDGRLRIDDVIMTVNDVNLEHVTHEFAVETLKNAGSHMTLVIRRLKDEYVVDNQVTEEYQPNQFNDPQYPDNPDAYEEKQEEAAEFMQFEVILVKPPGGGLGFSISGGYDPSNENENSYITISKLTPNGIAERDGRLQVGDILLYVNEESLDGMTHSDAVNLLKNVGKEVTLYVGRFVAPESQQYEEPEPEIVEKTEKKKKKKHRRGREE